MKPDDIPQWAWDEADDTTYDIDTDGRGSIEYTAARIGISRLVMRVRSQAFEEAADLIDEGFDKVVGDPYRDDGKPSKNDKCPHDRYMYEDCEACCSQAIRQHSQKGKSE